VLLAIAALKRRSQVVATSGLMRERGSWLGAPPVDGDDRSTAADPFSPAAIGSRSSGAVDTVFNFVDSCTVAITMPPE
jgi:hypothetical protein